MNWNTLWKRACAHCPVACPGVCHRNSCVEERLKWAEAEADKEATHGAGPHDGP